MSSKQQSLIDENIVDIDISHLNLAGLVSNLANNLKDTYGMVDDIVIPDQFHDIIKDFNKRNINPMTINRIISFCDFLQIDDTLAFVLSNMQPTLERYHLDAQHSTNYIFPNFILKGYENTKENVKEICKLGLLDWLKFAHENGCGWNSSTCEIAAGEGHLECLKYLHQHGCGWDEYT